MPTHASRDTQHAASQPAAESDRAQTLTTPAAATDGQPVCPKSSLYKTIVRGYDARFRHLRRKKTGPKISPIVETCVAPRSAGVSCNVLSDRALALSSLVVSSSVEPRQGERRRYEAQTE